MVLKSFRKIGLSLAVIGIIAIVFSGCAKDAYYQAKSINTVEAYDKFLKEYPNNKEFEFYAKKRREEAYYQKAKNINTIQAYNEYLKEYPDDEHKNNAKKDILNIKLKNHNLNEKMYIRTNHRDLEKGTLVTIMNIEGDFAIINEDKVRLSNLEKERSKFKLTLDYPKNATLKIDGKVMNGNDFWLKKGDYKVEVTNEKYKKYSNKIHIFKDTNLNIVLDYDLSSIKPKDIFRANLIEELKKAVLIYNGKPILNTNIKGLNIRALTISEKENLIMYLSEFSNIIFRSLKKSSIIYNNEYKSIGKYRSGWNSLDRRSFIAFSKTGKFALVSDRNIYGNGQKYNVIDVKSQEIVYTIDKNRFYIVDNINYSTKEDTLSDFLEHISIDKNQFENISSKNLQDKVTNILKNMKSDKYLLEFYDEKIKGLYLYNIKNKNITTLLNNAVNKYSMSDKYVVYRGYDSKMIYYINIADSKVKSFISPERFIEHIGVNDNGDIAIVSIKKLYNYKVTQNEIKFVGSYNLYKQPTSIKVTNNGYTVVFGSDNLALYALSSLKLKEKDIDKLEQYINSTGYIEYPVETIELVNATGNTLGNEYDLHKKILEHKLEQNKLSIRHAFKNGYLGQRYVPEITTSSLVKNIEKVRVKKPGEWYGSIYDFNTVSRSTTTKGGNNEKVEGYKSIYSLHNKSNKYYLVKFKSHFTAKSTHYETREYLNRPSSIGGALDMLTMGNTSDMYRKENVLVANTKSDIYSEGFMIKPNEQIKFQFEVGEDIPQDFYTELEDIIEVSEKTYNDFVLALSEKNKNLFLIDKFLNNPKYEQWHSTLRYNKSVIFNNKHLNSVKSNLTFDEKSYDPDFNNDVKLTIKTPFKMKVKYSTKFGKSDVVIVDKIFEKSFSLQSVKKEDLDVRIDYVLEL